MDKNRFEEVNIMFERVDIMKNYIIPDRIMVGIVEVVNRQPYGEISRLANELKSIIDRQNVKRAEVERSQVNYRTQNNNQEGDS